MKNINKCFLIIFLIIIKILINFKFLIFKKIKIKPLLIEIDISTNKKIIGPNKFVESINEILPYYTNNCNFISSKGINPINGRNKTDFFFIPFPRFNESIYDKWINISKINKLILGPIFVPNYWHRFPNRNIWKERRFPEIIRNVKGIGVHSFRVRNYLSEKSNTSDILNKYIIIRPCTNLNPKNITPFNDRKIDILFYEKYKDLNRRLQGAQLLKLLKNSSKTIEILKYGQYNKEKMLRLAKNSKFIIYFSFFDTGAIGLKEIQNYGVLAFSHQKDLVIDKETSFYVPELANENDMKNAYNIIIKKINNITKLNPNLNIIAKKNQEINKCENSLHDLCKKLN